MALVWASSSTRNQLRLARDRRIEVEFPQRSSSVSEHQVRDGFQAFEQPLGFRASVRLDIAHHHVETLGFFSGAPR